MNGKLKILAIAIAVLCIALTAYAAIVLQPKPFSTVQNPEPGYLGSYSIYLVSSSSKYGVYEKADVNVPSLPQVHAGDPCFIISVTLRNDYSYENQPPDSDLFNNTGYVMVMFTAQLFDKNGAQISAADVTSPGYPLGLPQHQLDYGETSSFDIVLATSSRDIDHYKINIVAVSPVPIP